VDEDGDLAVFGFDGGEDGVDFGVVGDVALEARCAGSSAMRPSASSFMRSF